MSRKSGLVVASLAPFPNAELLVEQLGVHDPDVQVVATPYIETLELRTHRGRNDGYNVDGLDTPEITDEMRATWADVDALIALDIPVDVAGLFPKLQWAQIISVGHEQLNKRDLAAHGVRLTGAAGIAAASIAEFVIGRLLQVWKHLRAFDAQQREHAWTLAYGTEMTGRTIGIVGFGAIGRALAVRCRAFGMNVVATRASAKPGDTDPDLDRLYPASELADMVATCNVVVSALPATPATEGLFDAAMFSAMPAGTVFCNVGRGMHVIEPDLIDALESGHLQAAILDVTATEPLPADDPLWDAPNLYLSPHSSVSLDRYETNSYALMAENLGRFLAGEPMRNEVQLPA